MLFKDTPYKVVKHLANFSKEMALPIQYLNENYIQFLLDRNAIEIQGKYFGKTPKFTQNHLQEIQNEFSLCSIFINRYNLHLLENQCTIEEVEALIKIEAEQDKINEQEISFQNIMTIYFGSSKHKKVNSNLAKAIKTVLNIDYFPEESKDQQFISILYPKKETRFIILCENKNRLIIPRHEFIEFWYAGGKNIKQLQFIPKPQCPIFYLFDWDFDGLNIYIDIKQSYFPSISAFIPMNAEYLMIEQSKVKNHYSKWRNSDFLKLLNEDEQEIAKKLLEDNSIIEEQKILLSIDNLILNGILGDSH